MLAMATGATQVMPGVATAGTGTWVQTVSGGSWGNGGNWLGGWIAFGVDSFGLFGNIDITTDNTVNLDTSRTLGHIIFGDTSPSHNWTLQGNGFALTMAVTFDTPQIIVNSGTADLRTVIAGSQGLSKDGTAALVLNALNTYTGGTTVNGGTLAVGSSGAVLPANQDLTVNNGTTFNYGLGATINNSSAPVRTMTLNNGTYRVSGGSGDFYLNKLVVGSTGGTVDLTGSANQWTRFTGAGAGITVNANSTWTGAGTSRFQNDTSALLPITFNNGATVTSSATFANGTPGFGYVLQGSTNNGTLYLKNPTATNTADFRVQVGRLRVDDMAALGIGAITLAGLPTTPGELETTGVLLYTGSTASSSKALTLDSSGGTIYLNTPGATLTLNGVIGETGGSGRALVIHGADLGPSTTALTAANTYTGATLVNYDGVFSIPTIANGGVASPLGASSNAPANLRLGGGLFGGDGTLRYTGPSASTDRGVTMNSATAKSTIDVFTAGTTLTMSGQLVGSGGLTKAGAGTLLLTGFNNTYANGTTVNAGTLAIGASAAALPAGKPVTVNSGATFNYGNGVGQVNGGSAIGTLTLNNGTYRVSGGSGDFYLNRLVIGSTGGTLDFTGTSSFWTHFTGAGAGITVNANSTWTGAGSSRIQNDTGALLPISLSNGTVTSSVNFSNGTSGFGYRLTADVGQVGALYLKNPTGGNTADFRVELAFLRVDDMAALGSGVITLAGVPLTGGATPEAGGILAYSGPTGTSSVKPLTLDAAGGVIYVASFNAALTLTGIISETGGSGRALAVWGGLNAESTLILTAANTYTGPTFVSASGILSIPTIANGGVASPIGASSGAPANLMLGGGLQGGDGTLRYTGPTAGTDRGVTLSSASFTSKIDVAAAGTTLTMSGQFVGAGGLTKAGPGKLVLTSATPATFAGTSRVTAGTLETTSPTYNRILTNAGGMDMAGGKFVLNYISTTTPLATVKSILTAGYNQPTKFSTGQLRATGLAGNLTLGYGDNGNAVTVMVTLAGDANLDGAVTFNDFLALQASFNDANTRFDQGNFNYDGLTDFNDFLALQTNFGQSVSDTPVVFTDSEVAALTAFAAANAPVPEPGSLALIGVAIGLLGRRRRAS